MGLRRHVGLLALALWMGCDDSFGSDVCTDGPGCAEQTGLGIDALPMNLVEVPTTGAAPLTIVWRSESDCPAPCTRNIELARAANDAVWTLPRAGGAPAIELIDPTGVRRTLPITQPDGVVGLRRYGLSQNDEQGRALVRVQWELERGQVGPDVIAFYDRTGLSERVDVRVDGRQPYPLGTLKTSQGYLLFDGGRGSSLVRAIERDGRARWHRTAFPTFASAAGSSALETSNGFVLGAGDGDDKLPSFGLLSLDATGRPLRFVVSSDSVWHDATLRALPGGGFVLAASGDLRNTGLGPGDGVVDLAIFSPGSDDVTGFRLRRRCAYKLTMNGLAVDRAGTLYVTSVTGDVEPRGLLCRLPRAGVPSCFQAEPNTLLGQLVVTDSGVIYVALGQAPAPTRNLPPDPPPSTDTAIARIELPAL